MRKLIHPSADAAAGEHGHGEPHLLPLKAYFGVLGALIFLTVVTVGVSELGLPMPLSIIVAMIVATIKATLVVSVFMHLIWDKKLNTVVFFAGVFWMLIFFSLTMVDLLSRDLVNPETGNYVMMDEALNEGRSPAGWVIKDPNYDPNADHGGDHAADAAHGDGGDHGDAKQHDAKQGDGGH